MQLYILFIILNSVLTGSWSFFQFNMDVNLDDYLISSLTGISLNGCMIKCANRPACESITYNRLHNYCRLYGDVASTTITERGTIYGEKSWWQISSIYDCNVTCSTFEPCDLTSHNMCIFTECTKPTNDYNADSMGNIRGIGSKVVYECITGALPDNGSVISTCGVDGKWSNITVICDLDGFVRYLVGYRYQMTAIVRGLYGDTIFEGISRAECTHHCKLEIIWCQAVSYRQKNRTCILVDGIWPPIVEDGWEVLHKIFPTTYSFGPNGRYTLTYQEGIEFCSSAGTSMASIIDLRSSYGMGYNRLDCGWVSEGTGILPTLYTVPNYWYQPGLGYCTWQNRWGVFCLDRLYPLYG